MQTSPSLNHPAVNSFVSDQNHAHADQADVLVAHSGKQHAYQHAMSLQRIGRLNRLVTSSYFKPDCFPDRLARGSRRLHDWLGKRTLEGLPSAKVIRRWRYELPEMICRITLGNGSTADNLVFWRDTSFDRWVAHNFAARARLFWGFQGSCLESLRSATNAGGETVLELATAHLPMAERILTDEAEKHPEWSKTISNFSFPDWYRQRLLQEPMEASRCVVASEFSRRSLLEVGIPDDRISTLPLGADLTQFRATPRNTQGPLRVLFVGGIGQRKGIKYLLEAIAQLNTPNIQLVLVGPMPADTSPLRPYANHFEYKGKLDQEGVANEMRSAHVLALPSVFEGFGLVIAEAMATGMPVIASTHSAGPELIDHGRNGYIIEPWDVTALATHLDALASDRPRTSEMGMHAAESAQRIGWESHTERLGTLLKSWTE